MKYEIDGVDETVVTLDTYNSDLNLVIDASKYKAHPLTNEGFAFMWAGARATHGSAKGKFCFEVKIIEHLDVSHLPADEPNPHVVRVGFSVDSTSMQLGEEPLSYGYGGTGKISTNCQFKDFGPPFTAGDCVLAAVNTESDPVQIGFAKNGKFAGWAYKVNKAELKGNALFPHVLTKNCSFEVNLGQKDEPFFKLPEALKDFVFIGCLPMDKRVGGTRAPATREECEMIMMCGLPGCGKSVWAADYSLKHSEKKYNILGTNNIIDKMKVMGLPRKRNYHGRWDVLIQMATKCLNTMFAIGSKLRRNYILDQTNVYPTAQRRKMRNFDGFKRIAVVIVPTEAEYKRRCDKRDREEGKEVPDCAVLEMKANFKTPQENDIFDEIIFTELQREAAEKLVKQYNEEGKAATGPVKKQFRSNEPRGFEAGKGNFGHKREQDSQGGNQSNYGGYGRDNYNETQTGFGGRGGYDTGRDSYGRSDDYGRGGGFGSNRGSYGGYQGGRGGFESGRGGRGGFDSGRGGRGGFDSSRGGRGSFDNGRGGRGSFDNGRGGRGSFDNGRGGRGGFDNSRGRGGFDSSEGGRGDYDSPSGFDSGRGGRGSFDSTRGGRGGFDSGRSGRGGYDSDRGGRGSYDSDRGSRGGYDNDRGSRGGYDSDRGSRGGYDSGRGSRGGYDSGRGGRGGYDSDRGGRGGYDSGRGSYESDRGGRGGYDSARGGRGGYDNGRGTRGGFESNRGGRGSFESGRGGRGDYGSSRGGRDAYESSGGYDNYGTSGRSSQSGNYAGSDSYGTYEKSSAYQQAGDGTYGTGSSYSGTANKSNFDTAGYNYGGDKNYGGSPSSNYGRGSSTASYQRGSQDNSRQVPTDTYGTGSSYSKDTQSSYYSGQYGYDSGSYSDYSKLGSSTADSYTSAVASTNYSSSQAVKSEPSSGYGGSNTDTSNKFSQGTGYSTRTKASRWSAAETPQAAATPAASAYSSATSGAYDYSKSVQSSTSVPGAQTYDYTQGMAATATQPWTGGQTTAGLAQATYASPGQAAAWSQYGQQPSSYQYYSQ